MSRYAEAHIDTKGPGDARPTALQIIKDEGLLGDGLAGKVALVTGGNTGIGLETARALHAAGATVYITTRSMEKGEAAKKDILSSSTFNGTNGTNGTNGVKGADVHILQLTLDSLSSVRACAKAFLSQSSRLDILVLNAGIMACPQGKTQDGFETQFGTNHLGHFLLFTLLRSTLLSSSTPEHNSRVVCLSSMAHRVGRGILPHDYNFEKEEYDPWVSYSQAKTANIYLANEIDRRYGNRGLHALSLHPGGIMTGLQAYVSDDIMHSWTTDPKMVNHFKSAEQGAATTVLAAVGREWEGKGGRYLNNCVEAPPMKEGNDVWDLWDDGYAPWAYDVEKARTLWRDSCKMVGVEDDE